MSYHKSPQSTLERQATLSSCYFCSESMPSKYLPEHITHCGAVLEECPEKCGAYVPRNELHDHLAQCFRGLNGKIHVTSASLDDRIRSLRESAWKNKVVSILSLLRTAVYDGEKEIKEMRDTLVSSLQLTNEALRRDILEELFENRRINGTLSARLTSLEKTCAELQQSSVQNAQQTASQLDGLRFETTTEREKCYAVIETMKAEFTAQSATICRLWQEQVQNIHDMRLELEMRCKLSKELVNQYNCLFDKVEALERQAQKHSETVQQQATNCKSLRFQMKQNVRYVEERLSERVCGCQSPAIGRLIWRIDHYQEKMDEAKREDSVLLSPLFSDKEYGYTLRMELHLNGLGQWKNRHVIGCLRVLDGKWDPLLDWPCVLRADVILRDQENTVNDVEKFVKTVKKGRDDEDSEERSSDLYMFIPHTTLARHPGYTKDDVMFLEIRIKDPKFTGSTISLV